ncbi:MAG TPA: hypothetical protein GX520_11890 [Syntrophaceticus sp.]|nr:hypothetical protein [Syntrophaceticus sp.]
MTPALFFIFCWCCLGIMGIHLGCCILFYPQVQENMDLLENIFFINHFYGAMVLFN